MIPLTTPFFYNPNEGNLLLDIRNYSGGLTFFLDAQSSSGDPISQVFGLGVENSLGDLSTAGLVTRFDVVAVPEPSALQLVVLGGAVISVLRLFHKKNKKRKGENGTYH